MPIWIGGYRQKALDRAARLGDGFIFAGSSRDQVAEKWRLLREQVRDLGRSEEFGGEWIPLVTSGVADHAADIEAWREVGGTHAAVVTMGLGLDSVDAHLDYLASIASSLSLASRPR